MKTCSNCEQTKSESEFSRYKPRKDGPFYLRTVCKTCKAESSRIRQKTRYHTGGGKEKQQALRAANREQFAKWDRRGSWRRQGIDPDLAEAYYSSHNGLCEICEKPSQTGKALHMDHCHKTGKIRGMLCSDCNNGLGRFKDNPEYLNKAAEYIKQR